MITFLRIIGVLFIIAQALAYQGAYVTKEYFFPTANVIERCVYFLSYNWMFWLALIMFFLSHKIAKKRINKIAKKKKVEAEIKKLKIWVTCNKCNTEYTDEFKPEEMGREYVTCPECGNKDSIHLLYLAHEWE